MRDWPAGAPWKFPGLLRPAYACIPMQPNGGTFLGANLHILAIQHAFNPQNASICILFDPNSLQMSPHTIITAQLITIATLCLQCHSAYYNTALLPTQFAAYILLYTVHVYF